MRKGKSVGNESVGWEIIFHSIGRADDFDFKRDKRELDSFGNDMKTILHF